MRALLTAVTDLGDAAVLLPLTVAASASLVLSGDRRAATVLVSGMVTIGLIVAGLKLALIGCGPVTPVFNIRSPSGHAALSMVIYGLFAHVMAQGLGLWLAWLVRVGVTTLILAIGVSRILLGFHTWQEVAAGGILGAGILAACRRSLDAECSPRMRVATLALLCLPLMVALNGFHLPIETAIRQYASLLRAGAPFCAPNPLGVFAPPPGEAPKAAAR